MTATAIALLLGDLCAQSFMSRRCAPSDEPASRRHGLTCRSVTPAGVVTPCTVPASRSRPCRSPPTCRQGRQGQGSQRFWEWAWARHANPLSWYIRPLLLLPFVYFAYKRSWKGIAVTLVAVATSMFWFPAPENPDPQIIAFLEAEQEYLTGGWTAGKVALSALIPLSMWALAAAFWRRSLGWGLVVLNAIAVTKTAWSVVYDEGGAAVIAPAMVGLALTNAAVIAAVRWRKRRHDDAEAAAVADREPVGLG